MPDKKPASAKARKSPTKAVAPIVDVRELLDDIDLINIGFFEINAKRSDSVDEAKELTSWQALQTATRDDGKGFRVRIRANVEFDEGQVAVDVAAEYELRKLTTAQVSDELILEYVNEVAVMQIIPYLRQSIADVTQRIWGQPLLLPVLKRGEMTFATTDLSVQGAIPG